MRRWLAGLFVLVAQLVASTAFGQGYVPDELLVKFKPGTPPSVQASLHRALGATVRDELRAVGVEVVALPKDTAPMQAAALYARSAAVQYAEPSPIFTSTGVPSDPSYPQEWGLDRIQAPAAWDVAQ